MKYGKYSSNTGLETHFWCRGHSWKYIFQFYIGRNRNFTRNSFEQTNPSVIFYSLYLPLNRYNVNGNFLNNFQLFALDEFCPWISFSMGRKLLFSCWAIDWNLANPKEGVCYLIDFQTSYVLLFSKFFIPAFKIIVRWKWRKMAQLQIYNFYGHLISFWCKLAMTLKAVISCKFYNLV